jgi:hypothetical protein
MSLTNQQGIIVVGDESVFTSVSASGAIGGRTFTTNATALAREVTVVVFLDITITGTYDVLMNFPLMLGDATGLQISLTTVPAPGAEPQTEVLTFDQTGSTFVTAATMAAGENNAISVTLQPGVTTGSPYIDAFTVRLIC